MTGAALKLAPRGDLVAFDRAASGANGLTSSGFPAKRTEPLECLRLAHLINGAEVEVTSDAGNEEVLCHCR